jgi:hypothetical protein
MSESLLVWGLVFGSAGLGFFMYGKRQKRMMPYVCGIGLMIMPYFLSDTLMLIAAGMVLLVLPFWVRV